MIEGVRIKRLSVHADERGFLMEILRSDDEVFGRFGQVYLTTAYPGVVKAWHMHKKQTDYWCVLKGTAKVGLYDERESSPTIGELQEVHLSERSPMVLTIPPGIWHGFRGAGDEVVYLLNCPTESYNHDDPDEFRRPYDDAEIGYDWSLQYG